jgi:hypothetical protein
MRVVWFTVILGLVVPAICLAYEPGSMLNLNFPAVLEKGQAEIQVQHRFLGQVDQRPFQTAFGADGGANVGLMARLPIRSGFEIKAIRSRIPAEYVIDGSYSRHHTRIPLGCRLDAEYFRFRDFTPVGGTVRKNGFFGQLALQTDPLFGRAQPCLNLGYDSFFGRAGLGLGLTVEISKKLSVLGEYYPVWNRDNATNARGETGPENCFAYGIKAQTYGHHFFLMVGNSVAIGTRRLMEGTADNKLFFGFNIQRRLEF